MGNSMITRRLDKDSSVCVEPGTGDKGFGISVQAELENLDTVQEFIIGNERVPEHLKKKICLAAEEIFVNICSYAYEEGQGDVEIAMDTSEQIVVKFCDSGKKFNPLENMTDMGEYDMDEQIGGLGRNIAFDIAQEVHYEYCNGKNILILYFGKEETI